MTDFNLVVNGLSLSGDKLLSSYENPLESVYPTLFEQDDSLVEVETKVSPAPIQASAKNRDTALFIFQFFQVLTRI